MIDKRGHASVWLRAMACGVVGGFIELIAGHRVAGVGMIVVCGSVVGILTLSRLRPNATPSSTGTSSANSAAARSRAMQTRRQETIKAFAPLVLLAGGIALALAVWMSGHVLGGIAIIVVCGLSLSLLTYGNQPTKSVGPLVVKTYPNARAYEADAPAMIAKGYRIEGQLAAPGHVNAGRTLVKAAVFMPWGLLRPSRQGSKFVVTWVRH